MPVALAVVATVATVASVATGIVSGNKARSAQEQAEQLNQQEYNEERAQQAQNSALASRNEYRQERVARGRILAASEASGGEYSSGELGGIGALATNYSSNIGFQQSSADRAQDIGQLASQANMAQFNASMDISKGNELSSIFSGASNLAMGGLRNWSMFQKIPGTASATSGNSTY